MAPEANKGRVVDLRSDTVTKPTDAMREAMSVAEVGDDGWGGDFTVKELEAYAANLFNKEAGLFVPSGIMANLICVMTHCSERGSEAIVGDKSHICLYEQGGIAQIGGVHPRHLPNNSDGTIDLSHIEQAIREDDPHYPVTRLICLENTHNHCGGRVLSLQYMKKVREIAQKHGIAMHLDGARVMNAAAALGASPAEIAEHTDTVSFCLSKALGAPIGSIIVGKRDFIHRCHRLRKALGGQLRQVGILAAPGLIALKTMPALLGRDHEVAKYLGEKLNALEGLRVELQTIETNMVVVHVSDAYHTEGIIEALKAGGFLIAAMGKARLRLVTHHQVTQSDAEKVVLAFSNYLHAV